MTTRRRQGQGGKKDEMRTTNDGGLEAPLAGTLSFYILLLLVVWID